jgi:hypothetical protein
MERLNLLLQQERSARTVYEGRPLEFFARNVSRPPPPDKPKKPPKPPRLAHNRLTDDQAREIWRAHDAGHTKVQIAREIGRSTVAVDRVLSEDRPPEPPPMQLTASAPAPACEAIRRSAPSAEPVRPAHVLDWQARMSAWRFEDRYQKPRPKRRTVRMLTRTQIRQELHPTRPGTSTSINSKPKAVQSIAKIFG